MTPDSTISARASKLFSPLALVAILLSAPALAGEKPNVVELDVPDLEVVDQNGESGRFVTDFIGDDVAAITFTFTHCTTICPTLDGIFKRVQAQLGDRLGRDVRLLTLSVDPTTDIPERLERHAQMLDAQPGWRFLTGEKSTVTELLKSLEVFTPDIWDHPPTVYVVDGKSGVWQRLNGFPSPDRIVAAIEGAGQITGAGD